MNAISSAFVTLPEARLHLRSSTSADDADVTLKIAAASALVIEYVDAGLVAFKDSSGAFVSPYVDSSGDFLPPVTFKQATLLLLGYFYNQRDEDVASEFENGRLPRPVRALLNSYRYLPT